jgi:hypothetical protein
LLHHPRLLPPLGRGDAFDFALPEPESDFDGRADDLVQQGNGDDALKQQWMYLHGGLRAMWVLHQSVVTTDVSAAHVSENQ